MPPVPHPTRLGRRSASGRSVWTLIPLTLLVWPVVGQVPSLAGAVPNRVVSQCDPGATWTTRQHAAAIKAGDAAREDPDLEAGFPVTAYETGGTGGGLGTHILVGNIDSDPSLEIMVSGLQTGPLYAWNADGSQVPGWPDRNTVGSAYPSLGKPARRSDV